MSIGIAVVSGGMDSTALVHYMHHTAKIKEIHGLSFDYGQRHVKEVDFAREIELLREHYVVDLSELSKLISKSVLTDHSREVPDGHYAEDSMKQTVVPNRNMIMLSIAVGYAVSIGAEDGVWTAVHAGDHFIYPDCRPAFITAVDEAAWQGNQGFIEWTSGVVRAPFLKCSKADIAGIGNALGVDFARTWSCYKGGEIHCGRCGTCVERKEAFRDSSTVDPTEYEDETFEVEAYRGQA